MPLTGAEKQRRYREKLKKDPVKLEEMRRKNLERIKLSYKLKRLTMTKAELSQQRKRWREQSYRSKRSRRITKDTIIDKRKENSSSPDETTILLKNCNSLQEPEVFYLDNETGLQSIKQEDDAEDNEDVLAAPEPSTSRNKKRKNDSAGNLTLKSIGAEELELEKYGSYISSLLGTMPKVKRVKLQMDIFNLIMKEKLEMSFKETEDQFLDAEWLDEGNLEDSSHS